jgi:hypothetical protein
VGSMSHATARRALLPSVVLAVLLGLALSSAVPGPVRTALAANAPAWEVAHVAYLGLVGLLGAVLWLLLEGARGVVAIVGRVAAGAFVLLYGAWEAMVGLGTTTLAGWTGAPLPPGVGAAESVSAITPLATAVGSLGAGAWVLAVLAAALVVRRSAGGGLPAGLLGLASAAVAFDFVPAAGLGGLTFLVAAAVAAPRTGDPFGALPVPAPGPVPRRSAGRGRRMPAIGQGTAFASLNLAWGGLRRVLKPDYVFVVYPGSEREKRVYFPEWAERLLRPLFPAGLMRFGDYWGLVVGGLATAESIEADPDRLHSLLEEAREEFPDVQVIALAGRLPSIAARNGVTLEAPFTVGDRGTLCTMLGAAEEQARLLGKPAVEVTIAVPGGAGFIGRQLAEHLSPRFSRVIALDPRYRSERRWEGNVLYTDRPGDIAEAEAVLVMTGRGDDAAGLVPFVSAGAVVADDTHPQMPARVRTALAEAGATVLRASVSNTAFRMTPPLPLMRPGHTPGCLLEALVVVHGGPDVLSSQDAFDGAAADLGFRASLSPHVDRART